MSGAEGNPTRLGTLRDRAVPFATMLAALALMAALATQADHALSRQAVSLGCVPLLLVWFWGLERYTGDARDNLEATLVLRACCAGMVGWLLYSGLR